MPGGVASMSKGRINSNQEIINYVLEALDNNQRNQEQIEEKAKIFSLCLDIPVDEIKNILIEIESKKIS